MPITPNEVAQTTQPLFASGGVNGALGELGSFSRGQGVGRGFTKSFDEWGYIIAFATIRSDVSYSMGIPAHMLRKTRVDHFGAKELWRDIDKDSSSRLPPME